MTYQEIKQEESCYVMNTYGRYPVALERGRERGSGTWRERNTLTWPPASV